MSAAETRAAAQRVPSEDEPAREDLVEEWQRRFEALPPNWQEHLDETAAAGELPPDDDDP